MNRLMDKQNVVHIHAVGYDWAIKRNEVLMHAWHDVAEPQTRYAQWKKPDPKEHILFHEK